MKVHLAIDFSSFDKISSQIPFSSFGIEQNGRNFSTSNFRYGFSGMEKDNEVKGNGNSYDFGARLYDSRTGRWLTKDKHSDAYPEMSGYSYVRNMPITSIDPDGKDVYIIIWFTAAGKGETHGHTAVAVDNYQQVKDKNGQLVYDDVVGTDGKTLKTPRMEKTGTYQYYDYWPEKTVEMKNYQTNVNADYNDKELSSIADFTDKDPSVSGEVGHQSQFGEGSPPDAVFKISTDGYNTDAKVHSMADKLGKNAYNASEFNCTTFSNAIASVVYPAKMRYTVGEEALVIEQASTAVQIAASYYNFQNTTIDTPNETYFDLKYIMNYTPPAKDASKKDKKKSMMDVPKTEMIKKPKTEPSTSGYLKLKGG